jgi:hypothetical protein
VVLEYNSNLTTSGLFYTGKSVQQNTQLKDTTQRKLAGVVSYTNQEVFHSH